jgi:hypothetical protein
MWPQNFSDRLESWNQLRNRCQNIPFESALEQINSWWFHTPWRPYYLHWDDQATWPDPWQLLSDNIFCDVARGLGMLYTITLLDLKDTGSAQLVLTESGHNLVLVDSTKYILNWEKHSVVNNNLELKIRRQYQQHPIK